jgi:peroxiredoxin
VHLTDGADRGRDFLERHGWTFPALDDPEWELAAQWGVTGHPAIFLLDHHGRLVGGSYGEGNADTWDALAAGLIPAG